MKKRLLIAIPSIVLVAILLFTLIPPGISITGVGRLSIGNNVVLAVSETGEPKELTIIEKIWGYEYTLSSGDTVEVGDKHTMDFKPHLKLNRWDGECFIKVSLPTKRKIKPVIEGNKTKWIDRNIEAHFYPLEPRTVIAQDKDSKDVEFKQCELGGFEFEIILKKKPRTNKIVLNIETQGLKFYYQPPQHPDHPTWSEHESGGFSMCPDNVVGSYAVYHTTRTNMHRSKVDAEKYKCGKAFHIYRPKVVDAVGDWVWADLYIDKQAGISTITIPQDFLNSAVYPISTGTENFGYETIGTAGAYNCMDQFVGSYFTCPEAGTSSVVTVYGATGYWDYAAIVGIYKKSDNSQVGVSDPASTGSAAAWNEYVLEVSLTNQDYWLVAATNYNAYMVYDAGTSKQGIDDGFAWGSPPDTLVADNELDNMFSIYCTYTPAGADISNVPTSKDYGVVSTSSTYTTGLDHFSVTNNSGADVTITIKAIDWTGGVGWTLSDTATPDADTAGLKAGLDGGDYTIIVKKTAAYNTLVAALSDNTTQKWGLKLYTPTSHSDGAQKTTTVTLTATLD